VLIYSGRPKEGLAALEKYLRLGRRDPLRGIQLLHVAVGNYFCREYEAAVEAARQVIRSYPDYPLPYRWLAAALGQLGRCDEAREALAKVSPASLDMYVRNRVPWQRPEDRDHMLEGLRRAGWQESTAEFRHEWSVNILRKGHNSEQAMGEQSAGNETRFDRIAFEPGKMGRRACIGGLRITVGVIVSLIAEGVSRDEILVDYPDLEREDIRQALAYAVWLSREEIVPA
jgi:uncharacterized protein (DUF433 family)